MKKKISRAKAIELGLTRYTGRPCRRGHICERYTFSCTCVECARNSHSRFDKSPKGRKARRRYNTGPNGVEAHRRYAVSPKGIEAHRRYDDSPKGHETDRRYKDSPKGQEAKHRYDSSPKGLERNRDARHERLLERALDTTRDDFNPARAALLLAHAYQREEYCL